MKNLQLEYPVDEHLKPIKDSDSALTSMEISTTKLRVKDLEVTGTATGITHTDSTKLPLAGGNLTGDITITDTTAPQFQILYDALNYLRYSIASTGTTTIYTVGEGTTDSDLLLVIDGDISLDSANGNFLAKMAGTEFSVANSSYAGMILGYTTVGIDKTVDSVAIGTSYAVTDATHKVTFKAPPSGIVEISVSIYADQVSAGRYLLFGLSDNSTYNTLDVTHEHYAAKGDETDEEQIHHEWVITGLTPNTEYEYWLGAKTQSASAYTLRWGGDVTAKYQPFIMKAVALPTVIADYAVYG